MPFLIVPLKIVLFQIIGMLVSITIEAILFYYYLQFSRKKSIQYSTSINFFSNIFVWILFFFVQANVSEQWQLNIINYIFFNSFYDSFDNSVFSFSIVLAIFILFIVACFIELKALDLLQAFLQSSHSPSQVSDRPQLVKRLNVALVKNNPKNAFVIVVANALSGITVLLLMSLILNYGL